MRSRGDRGTAEITREESEDEAARHGVEHRVDRGPGRRPSGVLLPVLVTGGAPDTEDVPGLADRLLRVPLYHKLVGANVVLLLATLAGALWVAGGDAPDLPGGSLLLGGLVVGIGVVINLALVRTALRPVEEIEETARRVQGGDFDARARVSPVADRDLRRLTGVFNSMLDVVDDYHRRQRALTLRTFEREERDQAETARRLRESTAQRVATLLVHLRALRNEVGDSPAVDHCQELARQTLEELRRTARGLRRPEIDDLGVGRALRAYATDLAGDDGPRIELEGSSLRQCLTEEARFRLYRIMQEAVSNAIEHAAADSVAVAVGVRDGRARIEIRDDGVGLRGSEGEGLGLIAMRERARDMGAELTVESEPDRGTRVRAELPCDAGGGDRA